MVDDVIILGTPFLESTHAQIDVFNEEILFEIGSKKFKFDINSHQCIEKIYMVDIGQEEENFNPLEIGIDLFSYESPACLEFEKRISEDYGMWPTFDPDSKSYFGYKEVFGVNEQGYVMDNRISMIQHGNEEWMRIRIGHNNLHESDREFIFNEWILDSYDVEEEYAREIGDLYSRRFDEYNRVFNNEIEHLSNEYILRIGKKGYYLDDVWEKCQQNYKKTNEAWHDEAYEVDKMW
ncbi:hypothetical protein Tco_0327286 [Tanacetum coccineum]